jgi:hypothetical protein
MGWHVIAIDDGVKMNDAQYIELMKQLRPNVIISDELVAMFKQEYPVGSLKLMKLQGMLKVNALLTTHKAKTAAKKVMQKDLRK